MIPRKTRHETFRHSIELAQHAERLGYERVWYAEHHGGRIGAGRAPERLIAGVAAPTERIRLGPGGGLRNHYRPYTVAEQSCAGRAISPGRAARGGGTT